MIHLRMALLSNVQMHMVSSNYQPPINYLTCMYVLKCVIYFSDMVHSCSYAGDLRVNEQPMLGAIHALFLNEHNRIARHLNDINLHWDDEKIYQETKRIVNAEWQHIIYNEWLPQLIGVDLVKKFGLLPLTGKDFNYDYL